MQCMNLVSKYGIKVCIRSHAHTTCRTLDDVHRAAEQQQQQHTKHMQLVGDQRFHLGLAVIGGLT